MCSSFLVPVIFFFIVFINVSLLFAYIYCCFIKHMALHLVGPQQVLSTGRIESDGAKEQRAQRKTWILKSPRENAIGQRAKRERLLIL